MTDSLSPFAFAPSPLLPHPDRSPGHLQGMSADRIEPKRAVQFLGTTISGLIDGALALCIAAENRRRGSLWAETDEEVAEARSRMAANAQDMRSASLALIWGDVSLLGRYRVPPDTVFRVPGLRSAFFDKVCFAPPEECPEYDDVKWPTLHRGFFALMVEAFMQADFLSIDREHLLGLDHRRCDMIAGMCVL